MGSRKKSKRFVGIWRKTSPSTPKAEEERPEGYLISRLYLDHLELAGRRGRKGCCLRPNMKQAEYLKSS